MAQIKLTEQQESKPMRAYITLHQRGEHGWHSVKTLAENSDQWGPTERKHINYLMEATSGMWLTIGYSMYELTWRVE